MTHSDTARAFLGGLWAGNALPHLINGLANNRYPCKLGSSPASNVLAGAVALSIVPFLLGPDRPTGATVRWTLAGVGATVSLVVHARFVNAWKPELR